MHLKRYPQKCIQEHSYLAGGILLTHFHGQKNIKIQLSMAELRFISSGPLELDASHLVRCMCHLSVIITLMRLVQYLRCCAPVLEAMVVYDQSGCVRYGPMHVRIKSRKVGVRRVVESTKIQQQMSKQGMNLIIFMKQSFHKNRLSLG